MFVALPASCDWSLDACNICSALVKCRSGCLGKLPRTLRTNLSASGSHADLDLGAALQDTGVAIVTEEVPTNDFVRQEPRVYFTTPVSVVYASAGDLLVAYATDMSTGKPASDVIISLDANNAAVRALLAAWCVSRGTTLRCFASVQQDTAVRYPLCLNLFLRTGQLGVQRQRHHRP